MSLILLNVSIFFLVREIIYSYLLFQRQEFQNVTTILIFAVINLALIALLLWFDKKLIKLQKQKNVRIEHLLFAIMLFIVSMALYFYEIMTYFLSLIAQIKHIN